MSDANGLMVNESSVMLVVALVSWSSGIDAGERASGITTLKSETPALPLLGYVAPGDQFIAVVQSFDVFPTHVQVAVVARL
ncbi:MAG: hypothetical protein ABSH08_21140 [Tepidisphaeraceae bacterium]